MKQHRLILAAAAGAAMAAPAHAGILHDGVQKFEIGGVSIDPRGRAFYDTALGEQDYQGAIPALGHHEWRTARFGADIVFSESLKSTAEFNIAENDFQPTDLFLAWTPRDGLTLTVGQFKEAFSIDELTSSRFQTFMERGSVTDIIDLARRFGGKAAFSGANWSVTAALQGAPMDGLEIVDGIWGVSARASVAPLLRDNGDFVHLGAAVRWRDRGDGADPLLRYRQRPMAHLSEPTIATPRIGESDMSYGLEAAAGMGSLHAAAEYIVTDVEGAAADARFDAFYISAGWFLTGEHRNYVAEEGKFDRTDVLREAGQDGFGAIELLARYDHADLTDGAIAGGMQESWTLGAVWYPTSRTRIMMNYVDADVDDGAYDDGQSRILETRFQIDW